MERERTMSDKWYVKIAGFLGKETLRGEKGWITCKMVDGLEKWLPPSSPRTRGRSSPPATPPTPPKLKVTLYNLKGGPADLWARLHGVKPFDFERVEIKSIRSGAVVVDVVLENVRIMGFGYDPASKTHDDDIMLVLISDHDNVHWIF